MSHRRLRKLGRQSFFGDLVHEVAVPRQPARVGRFSPLRAAPLSATLAATPQIGQAQ